MLRSHWILQSYYSNTNAEQDEVTHVKQQQQDQLGQKKKNTKSYQTSSIKQSAVHGFPTSNNELLQNLPDWIQEYIEFHNEVRSKYPDESLITSSYRGTDKAKPKVLIRVCTWLCGGLNDRLLGILYDLYIAHQTKRVYLIKWTNPYPLEEFLIPNLINWTVPYNVGLDSSQVLNGKLPHFYFKRGNYLEDAMEEFINGTRMNYNAPHKNLMNEPVVAVRYLGDDNYEYLQKRLQIEHGYEQSFIHKPPTFGYIFHALFQPSPPIKAILQSMQNFSNTDQSEIKLNRPGLIPGQYHAVQARVRHPKGVDNKVGLNGRGIKTADVSGLIFEGDYKEFAIRVATHAVQCLLEYLHQHEDQNSDEPKIIYFFSDSNDTAAYMTGPDSPFHQPNYKSQYGYKKFKNVLIVSRPIVHDTLHIDKQRGEEYTSDMYYDTFIDLFMAIQAKCLSYDLGNFGYLASRISGTECKMQHREYLWNIGGVVPRADATICTPPWLDEEGVLGSKPK